MITSDLYRLTHDEDMVMIMKEKDVCYSGLWKHVPFCFMFAIIDDIYVSDDIMVLNVRE